MRLTVLGDSISAAATGWPYLVINSSSTYKFNVLNNRAVGNTTILNDGTHPYLATQVTAAASDDADAIIIEAGTNQTDADDMEAIQAEVETQIAALKVSNPRAVIYYMNILPRDPGAPKTNLRAAIAAACAAEDVTCWDTYTDPWIDWETDTSDGLHPNAAGHAKIATEVLARI
jgi:lysophospholipase L1-like esterase